MRVSLDGALLSQFFGKVLIKWMQMADDCSLVSMQISPLISSRKAITGTDTDGNLFFHY